MKKVGDILTPEIHPEIDILNQIINGAPIESVNPATLRNPECLAHYVDIGEGLRKEVSETEIQSRACITPDVK